MHRALAVVFPAVLILALPAVDARADVCSLAPVSGCKQSDRIKVRVRRDADPARDRLRWSWKKGDDVEAAELGDATATTGWGLCVYDGDATLQDEIAAPLPGTDSLLLDLDVPSGAGWKARKQKFRYKDRTASVDGIRSFQVRTNERGRAVVRLGGKGAGLGLSALDGADAAHVISQVQSSDGTCFGADVTIEFSNPPIFPLETDVVDPAAAGPRLDALGHDYNAAQAGAPLNMTLWISGAAASQVQHQIVTSDPDDLDEVAIFSAVHVAGWYGGLWFARDGFGFPPGAGPDEQAVQGALDLYARGRDVALDGTDADVAAYLVDEVPVPGAFDEGTGLRSLISLYAYNTGYAIEVIDDDAGGVIVPPPPSKLACAGSHPPLPEVADAPLLSCTYDPSFLPAVDPLRPVRDAYVAAFPAKAEELRLFSNDEEGRGREVWALISGAIIADQGVREALWDVDSAFLEVLHVAALKNMQAQVDADPLAGRQAAMAEAMLKGWLSSYLLGLGAPDRTLPTWNLGVTSFE